MARNNLRDMVSRTAGRGQKRKLIVKDAETKISVQVDQRPAKRDLATVVKIFADAQHARFTEPADFGDGSANYSELMDGRDAADVAAQIYNSEKTADEVQALTASILGEAPTSLPTPPRITPDVLPAPDIQEEKPTTTNGGTKKTASAK